MNQQLLDLDELPLVLGFLDAMQEGIWWRCYRWCKAARPERMLPLEHKAIEGLAMLSTVAESKALEGVLLRCFEAVPGQGYKRRPFASEEAARVAHRAAAAERQQAVRERRKALFAEARELGLVLRCTATTAALEGAIADARHSGSHSARHSDGDSEDHSRSHSLTPVPLSSSLRSEDSQCARDREPTQAAAACIAMRRAGMADVNTSHPGLLRLLDAGVTDEELALAAAECVAREKPFAYLLQMIEGRRRDAARKGPVAPAVDLLAQLAPSVAAMRDAARASHTVTVSDDPWIAEA